MPIENEQAHSNIYLIPTEALQTLKQPAHRIQFKDYPDVITVEQTADLLGVCKNTVYKLIREKEIPCRRIGTAIRIRKRDVALFMKKAS